MYIYNMPPISIKNKNPWPTNKSQKFTTFFHLSLFYTKQKIGQRWWLASVILVLERLRLGESVFHDSSDKKIPRPHHNQ
jgi:hypothetical protein